MYVSWRRLFIQGEALQDLAIVTLWMFLARLMIMQFILCILGRCVRVSDRSAFPFYHNLDHHVLRRHRM